MLFHCKKLCASAPLREITVPTPLPSSYMFNCLSLKMSVPFRTIQKIHTNCCFRAEAQGRRVNTFIKRHLPLKSSFIAKSSAPQRLCARSQCLRQLTARPPARRSFRAGAQSEHNQQETSSPKNALLLQKALRLSASARDHSAYAIAQQLHVQLPIPKNVCAIQDNPKNPDELLFSRRGAESNHALEGRFKGTPINNDQRSANNQQRPPHNRKLCASAPLREIILFALQASRTTAIDSP